MDPSSPYSAPFSYSKTPFTCDINSSSTTLPSYLSVNISPDVHEGYSALSDSTASSSLVNGDLTTRQYVQQQPLQHHLHEGSLPPPLVAVSHHQPSALPPPLIPKAEPHSPACSFSASSSGAPWWQLQHVGNTTNLQYIWLDPGQPRPFPWQSPSLTHQKRTGSDISPMSPSCTPSPLSAPCASINLLLCVFQCSMIHLCVRVILRMHLF